jgi:hypothetical protein
MNCATARELLALIRPDSRDADQLDCAAELAHLEQCAECQAFVEQHQRADRELGQAMRNVAVPADLKQRLLAQLAQLSPATARAAETTTTAIATPTEPATRTVPPARRIWNHRRMAAVAALLLLALIGSGWFLFVPRKPTLRVEDLITLAHQRIGSETQVKSVQLDLPVREIHMPATAEALSTAISLTYQRQEIGAAIPYQMRVSRRNTIEVMLVVFDLRRVNVPDLKGVGSNFWNAGVSYPPPNAYATRVWRSEHNLYVCFVISKNPEDLERLQNQPTSA